MPGPRPESDFCLTPPPRNSVTAVECGGHGGSALASCLSERDHIGMRIGGARLSHGYPVLALRKMVVPHPQDWVPIVLPQCREGGPVTCVLPVCTCMGSAHCSRRKKTVSMLSSDVIRRWHQKIKSFRICAPGPLHLKSQQCHWRP